MKGLTMKITKLVQSYGDPEGLTNVGDKIEVTDDRATQLIAAGYAVEGWVSAKPEPEPSLEKNKK
jgi:hypothetical protein